MICHSLKEKRQNLAHILGGLLDMSTIVRISGAIRYVSISICAVSPKGRDTIMLIYFVRKINLKIRGLSDGKARYLDVKIFLKTNRTILQIRSGDVEQRPRHVREAPP